MFRGGVSRVWDVSRRNQVELREGLALTTIWCGNNPRALYRTKLSLQQVNLPGHLSPYVLQYCLSSSWQPLVSSGTTLWIFILIPHLHH